MIGFMLLRGLLYGILYQLLITPITMQDGETPGPGPDFEPSTIKNLRYRLLDYFPELLRTRGMQVHLVSSNIDCVILLCNSIQPSSQSGM
jgi:hypothetical protein